MEFLKKIKLPVALKSEPGQPQAQPQPESRKAPPDQKPPVQSSAQPRPPASPQVRPHPTQPQAPVWAQAAIQTQPQPQAPVWAQTETGTQAPGPVQARLQASPQPLRVVPRVTVVRPTVQVAAQATAQTAAQPVVAPQPETNAPAAQPRVHPVERKAANGVATETEVTQFRTTPGTSGPTGHLSGAPGLWRTVWAMHPNRTTRRLRRLLLSWEKLGAYMSSPGAGEELTSAAETTFLRTKIEIARSVGYLKLLDGNGGITKEADQREVQFIELLERFPSLHSVRTADATARRSLYYNWHQLYLFLHKMLGADLYETRGSAAAYARRVETVIGPGRTVSTGGRRMG